MELKNILPTLTGLVDPKVEREIMSAFMRLHDILNEKIRSLDKSLGSEISRNSQVNRDDLNGLIGVFSQPLAGDTSSDPLLQGVVSSFSAQAANTFFSGPDGVLGNPAFRNIVVNDIPTLPKTKLDAQLTYSDDTFTKEISAAPYVNDGYIILKLRTGQTIKLMTTA